MEIYNKNSNWQKRLVVIIPIVLVVIVVRALIAGSQMQYGAAGHWSQEQMQSAINTCVTAAQNEAQKEAQAGVQNTNNVEMTGVCSCFVAQLSTMYSIAQVNSFTSSSPEVIQAQQGCTISPTP